MSEIDVVSINNCCLTDIVKKNPQTIKQAKHKQKKKSSLAPAPPPRQNNNNNNNNNKKLNKTTNPLDVCMHSDVYEPIWIKLAVVIDTTKLLI